MPAFLNPLRAFASRRARPSDQTALSPIEFSTKEEDLENRVKPSMVAPKKQEEEGTLDKKERVIREKLARFACVPADAIFEFVPPSSAHSVHALTISQNINQS